MHRKRKMFSKCDFNLITLRIEPFRNFEKKFAEQILVGFSKTFSPGDTIVHGQGKFESWPWNLVGNSTAQPGQNRHYFSGNVHNLIKVKAAKAWPSQFCAFPGYIGEGGGLASPACINPKSLKLYS